MSHLKRPSRLLIMTNYPNIAGYFKDSSVYEYLWQEVNQEYLQSLVHHFELSIPKLEATFTFLDSKTEAER